MVSSIHFSDQSYEKLYDLIGHHQEKNKTKLSASKLVSSLIDKEHASVKPKRYEKGKETGSVVGIQEQSSETTGEQNDSEGTGEESNQS